jgi:hypothetical protein
MGMAGAAPLGCGGLDLISPIGQHVADMRVFAGAQAQGDGASCLQSGLAIAFGEGQQAKASAVGVLGVALALQHLGDNARTGHTDTFSPGDQALGVGLVGQGQMFGGGGIAALVSAAHVAGHPLTAVQHFYGCSGNSKLQGQPDQGMGHAVAVTFKLDVAVDVNPHRLEAGPLPGLCWQGQEGRGIELGKGAGTAAGELLKQLVVQAREQRCHSVVDGLHRVKALVAQACQYPALHQQYAEFNLGFVLRVVGARGQHRAAVVAGKVQHAVRQTRLVAVGLGDQGAWVVGDDELG